MDELLKSFNPLIIISGIFGFLPINVNPISATTNISKTKLLIAILFLVIFNYFVYLRISNMDNYREEGSFLSKITIAISILLNGAFYLVTVITNTVSRETIGMHMRTLYKFDEKVSKMKAY